MFRLAFLFGDENRQLKELEQSRRLRELEEEEKKITYMVKDFAPFLAQMEVFGMVETSVVFSDLSRFDYTVLPKALSKLGSKIAYTRLEKEGGVFTLTLYKNQPEAISRLHRAYILRLLLWFIFALLFTVPVYLFSKAYLDLLQPTFIATRLFDYLLAIIGVSVIWICANISSSLVFRQFKIAEEFKHTLRFDKVVEDD